MLQYLYCWEKPHINKNPSETKTLRGLLLLLLTHAVRFEGRKLYKIERKSIAFS